MLLMWYDCRDGKTPKEQSRQIEAIYPIVKGQKADERHAVVARRAVARDKDAAKAETSEAGNAKPAAHEEEDLIDFGQHDEKSEPEWPPTAETGSDGGAKGKTDAKGAGGERPSSTKGEIAEILDATGKAAPDSPLIDFHEDLKNAVPSETAKPAAATAGIKRTDTSTTEESADEFHDAEE